jgi:hypothetical protein
MLLSAKTSAWIEYCSCTLACVRAQTCNRPNKYQLSRRETGRLKICSGQGSLGARHGEGQRGSMGGESAQKGGAWEARALKAGGHGRRERSRGGRHGRRERSPATSGGRTTANTTRQPPPIHRHPTPTATNRPSPPPRRTWSPRRQIQPRPARACRLPPWALVQCRHQFPH